MNKLFGNKFRLLLFFLFAVLSESNASHYMGGEITWECLTNGKYRFMLKLYRECNGITYGNTEYLTVTNCPSLSSITMTLVSQTDISPVCNSAYPNIICNPSPVSANTGAVEEWYYTSDASYPTGVLLSGVPPAQGWIISHNSCCRNPCTNILNASSLNWYLRAIMYSYNGENTNPCFDNSPQFAEKPPTAICSGKPFSFNANVSDKDMDSLSYQWAAPFEDINTPILSFSSGYSYTNPFPDASVDSNNIPASINPNSGEVSFLSYTNGAFLNVLKITSYKCGIKVSEIFREFEMLILACDENDTPIDTPPFINSVSGVYENYSDTVYAGENVHFSMNFYDNDTLDNGSKQTLKLSASGSEFGLNYSNDSIGCSTPPCATLSLNLPFVSQDSIHSEFSWQTDCKHLLSPAGCSSEFKTYYFVFDITDDFCPVPAYKSITASVIVRSLPLVSFPVLDSLETQMNGDVVLHWQLPVDTANTFNSYHIYYSQTYLGPYIHLDSIFIYTQNSYTHYGANILHTPGYYYMETRSGCGGAFYSGYSDTLFFNNTGLLTLNTEEPSVKVFPNPFQTNPSVIISKISVDHHYDLVIVDLRGKIYSIISVNSNVIELNTSGLSSGYYYISLKEDGVIIQNIPLLKY